MVRLRIAIPVRFAAESRAAIGSLAAVHTLRPLAVDCGAASLGVAIARRGVEYYLDLPRETA